VSQRQLDATEELPPLLRSLTKARDPEEAHNLNALQKRIQEEKEGY
jgi:hypothetical protein